MNYGFDFWKLAVGAIATIGLYSVLYRENKFFRLVEHIFLGLAAGFTIYAVWRETLYENWWLKLCGSVPSTEVPDGIKGHWAYILILPFGFMAYFVFNKRHNWMARIPIGIILGFWAGQEIQNFWNRWGKQIYTSMQPLVPTTSSFAVPSKSGLPPEEVAKITSQIYISQALSNAVFVFTILSVLSYFFFSFDVKNKAILKVSTYGRWILMVGLGALFGSTVMARFSLVIDRMFFIFVEFIKQGIFHMK
jgi:hypothetical protein